MKRFYNFIFLGVLIFFCGSVSAQVACFKSFRETKGIVTPKSNGLYVWGPWEQSNAYVLLDMSKKNILVHDAIGNTTKEFEIFDKPENWTRKKNYKVIKFECMEKVTMEKFYVRLYEYDSGEFRVTVMDPKNATRYSVVYINEDEVPDNVNFSETTAKAE